MRQRVVGLGRLSEKSRVYRAYVYGEDARLVVGIGLFEGNALPQREQEKGKLDDGNMGDGNH